MPQDKGRSEFWRSVRLGALVGAAALVVVIPWVRMTKSPQPPAQPPVVMGPAQQAPSMGSAPAQAPEQQATAPQSAPSQPPARQFAGGPADFGAEEPSPEARHVANWAVHSKDHRKHAFVIVDKQEARVYVFGPDGKLKDSAPALLGSAHGDHSVPGIGDKPLSAIKPDEKTTPAGRFKAEPGKNTNGEDIIWVDYDAAVSMHRIRPLVAKERRLERLATLTVDDNRISFGCINLPVSFYEEVLSPTVHKYGAIVYVLPETKKPQQVFGSYDVDPATAKVAQQAPKKRT